MDPVVLAGGAFLLWWLLRPHGGAVAPTASGPSSFSSAVDFIVGDVDNGEPDFFRDFGRPILGAVADSSASRGYRETPEFRASWAARLKARKQAFLRQVWLPASRIPMTALTDEDFQRAEAFLSGQMKRCFDLPTEATMSELRALNSEAQDAGAAAQWGGLPGQLLGGGNQTNFAVSLFGLDSKVKEEAQKYLTTAPEVFADREKALGFFLQTDYSVELGADGLPKPLEARQYDDIPAQYDYAYYLQNIAPLFPAGDRWADSRAPWEFFTDPFSHEGKLIAGRMGIFSPGGWGHWRYPWISEELGARKSLRERVYLWARLYRALDVIGWKTYPYFDVTLDESIPDPAAAHGVYEWSHAKPGTYMYNSKLGAVKGSVFPPLPQDKGKINTLLVAGQFQSGLTPEEVSHTRLAQAENVDDTYVGPALTMAAQQPAAPMADPEPVIAPTPAPYVGPAATLVRPQPLPIEVVGTLATAPAPTTSTTTLAKTTTVRTVRGSYF